MSRPILSRPRTRIYGSNYDKGESYYKPMVDHLDRKYSPRPLFPEQRNSLADEIAARRSDIGTRDLSGPRAGPRDLDLEHDPRTRASQLPPLTDPLLPPDDEDTVYDSRGQRTRRRLGDDLAEEVGSTTNRLRARLAAMSIGDELEAATAAGQARRTAADLLESAVTGRKGAARTALEEAESNFKRRSRVLFDEAEDTNRPAFARWSKLINEDDELMTGTTSAAASRAKQSRARLQDLESEMEEIAERQAKRERRAAALRALVNESAAAPEDVVQQSTVSKKVSVRSVQGTEKHISF